MKEKPLRANAMLGVTVNIGNYQSLKVDVGISADHLLDVDEEKAAKRMMRQLLGLAEQTLDKSIEPLIAKAKGIKLNVHARKETNTRG